ncbi:hypothetical protein AY601_1781 [Pedobacter cryoconitis]|uniref:Uncharacterized protein n=1 Tax=Pedobacter cryoconitis TaxID=188932 RepID=A0A127VBH5_9SPHI|nr:hypothetical protein [Pedobacter cryoconitis]AMP98693.1 hypothetical protein AY601_1781 [Pedobacter cryoconitis]
MTSSFLENKNKNYALSLRGMGQYPSVVVGAEFSHIKVVDKSGPISPGVLVKSLRNRLTSLGTLYTIVNGNTLGCCAEVNSANKILEKRPSLEIYKINFSKALRPRTMQVVPKCKNCKKTFN